MNLKKEIAKMECFCSDVDLNCSDLYKIMHLLDKLPWQLGASISNLKETNTSYFTKTLFTKTRKVDNVQI